MLGLMSEKDFEHCSAVIEELRLQVHNCNTDIHSINREMDDQLDPPTPWQYQTAVDLKEYILDNRQVAVDMIHDIREVLVNPPSLESRVVGYVAPFLSYNYF